MEWIRIDLQAVYDLTGARITWEAAAAKNFKIQVSTDDASWTTVYTTVNGDGGTDGFTFTSSARYIRMYAGDRLTEYGYSIFEFEVFGTLRTGIEDISDTGSISVYPNPSSGGIVTLDFRGSHADEEVNITVTDMSGEIIGNQMIRVSTEGRAVFLLPGGAGLKPGIYIVTVAGERMYSHNKLVIK